MDFKSYFYYVDGKTNGPATQDDLRDLYDNKTINDNTLMHLKGDLPVITLSSPNWKKLINFKELHLYITKPLPSEDVSLENIETETPPISKMFDEIFENQKKMMKPTGIHAKRPHFFDESRKRYVTKDELFEFDFIKQKWISIVQENDIQQQMSIYNYTEESTDDKVLKKRSLSDMQNINEKEKDGNRDTKRQKINENKVSSIYVTNLPNNITVLELEKYFSKCGIIKYTENENPNVPLIKLYKNDDGSLKGDALISYLLPASVDLAIKILDETSINGKDIIRVEAAKFTNKDDNVMKKKKKNNWKKKKSLQFNKVKWTLTDDELDWELRSVIIKNMFKPVDFRDDPLFKMELKKDLTQECSSLGEVERVRIFENNPEGVVHIIFKYQYSAQECVNLMNGRFFDGRKLVCFFFDGKDYKVRESKEEEYKRLTELLTATTSKNEEEE